MNYYNPNYYMGGYPYNNQYPLPSQQQQQQQIMQNFPMNNQQMQTAPTPAQAGLNGKIVDSEDVVKATEVPIGGYGIFPKADLSEIYIKSWNNNGTTSVITFRPIIPEPAEQKQTVGDLSNLLLQKIEVLENKLDHLLQPATTTTSIESPQLLNKTEVLQKNGF